MVREASEESPRDAEWLCRWWVVISFNRQNGLWFFLAFSKALDTV